MDCTAWTDSLGSREVERLLEKIGQTLDFELVHAAASSREDLLHLWWYETSWADGKHLETPEAVCFPDSCGGFECYAFAEPSRLLHAVLQTRLFRVNVHKDGKKRRWLESHFVLNLVFNAKKSLEELEIALDLLGRREEELRTMDAEDKKKTSFAEVSWRALKKALKLLFERRLGAEIVEMQFIVTSWPPASQSLMVAYKDEACKESCCSLRWTEDHASVQAESWLDLASTLEAGAREGKSFSIGRKTVFGPGDSIESMLVEADLLGK